MAELESTFKNMFLSLVLICITFGAILAGVNELTKDPIALAKKTKLENAIRDVISDFDNDPVLEMYKKGIAPNDTIIIYPAKKGDNLIGAAVETQTMRGFSGEIRILTGLDNEGNILNYAVLHHAETPGLGDKMNPWFKTDKNNQNIIGKNLSQKTLKLSKDGGEIDAITAATITSRAFLDAVNKSSSAFFDKSTDADSGATSNDGTSGATSTDADSGATN
ncbi:MAG: RnfABCDGE type electron transport complex subunit G [Dysgonamonadaceae bacterium]|jgi:electron transport complex protein RnfG|nr:RnfABCDGE type electron transport complex subunit G [Dysgonamonadaceae bacterium]